MIREAGRRRLETLGDLLQSSWRMLGESAHLRVSLVRLLVLGLVCTEGFCVALAILHAGGAVPILLGGLVWWAVVAGVVVGGAALLTTPDGVGLDYYGLPNTLSAVRAWSCFPLLLCASISLPGRTGLLLWSVVGGAAGMLDFVDGLIARHVGPITALGKAIDPAGDATFFAVAAVGCDELGIVPTWLAAVILIRYLGPLIATPLVLLLTRKRPEVVHTRWGRLNTALVGVTLFVLLMVRVWRGPVATVALIWALPAVGATTLFYFVSLANRFRKAPRVPEHG